MITPSRAQRETRKEEGVRETQISCFREKLSTLNNLTVTRPEGRCQILAALNDQVHQDG